MDFRIPILFSFIFLHVSSGSTNGQFYVKNCSGLENAFVGIPENATTGTVLLNVTDVLDLHLEQRDKYGEFIIQNHTSYWTVETNAPLDYEKSKTYRIQICCRDKGLNREIPYNLTVNVENVVEGSNFSLHFDTLNEFKLNYTNSSREVIVTVPENTKNGTDILQLNAKIAGKEQLMLKWNITFCSLVDGNCVLDLHLAKTQGEPHENNLTLNQSVSYNNSTNNAYSSDITVWVEGHPEFTNTLKVTVKIEDVDDQNPKFDRIHYTASISEGADPNQGVIQIKAFDQDSGINQPVLYEIVDPIKSKFNITISNTPANISVADKLDREKQSMVTLLVKAYQKDKPSLRQAFAVVQINISDIDDNPPVMSQSNYSVIIPENMQVNQTVLRVEASDADVGDNAKFKFWLKNCTSKNTTIDAFAIDQESGKIRVNNSAILDMEKTQSIDCQVYAESGGKNTQKRSNISTITIQLMDVNDNHPVFNQSSYSFNITDESKVIGKVDAKDADFTNETNGKVTYEIIQGQGNYSKMFQINSTSGEISKKEWQGCVRLPRSVDIYVKASDNPSESSMKRYATVQVVIDVRTNLCPPRIILQGDNYSNKTYPIKVQEDYKNGSYLTSFQVKDEDPLSDVTCKMENNSNFNLLKKDDRTWLIQLIKPLDRELKDQYDLTVNVNDTKHVTKVELNITIEDINDNAPVFTRSIYSLNVTEETTNFSTTIQANDADFGENAKIEYQLIQSNWSSYFKIMNDSGVIQLIEKIDRETMGSSGILELTVVAKDSGTPPLHNTAVIHITINDINDNVPEFCDNTLEFTVSELDTNKIFYTAKAIDKDADDHNGILFKLINKTSSFKITETGELSVISPLNKTDIGELMIEAYNKRNYTNSSLLNKHQRISVKVQDINNNSPKFSSDGNQFSIPENTKVGSLIINVTATDDDWSEENGSVYYWITGGNTGGHFFINQLNGSLFLADNLDYEEQKNYTLTIAASDSRDRKISSHTVNKTLNIKVTDVNDEAPKFDKCLYICPVKENIDGNFNCTVKATDGDNSPEFRHVIYQLRNNSAQNNFEINNSSGEVSLKTALDYEGGNHNFTISVKASDENDSTLSSVCTLFIIVENIDDEPPKFQLNTYNFNVSENQPPGTIVGQVQAEDKDSSSLNYTLSNTDLPFDLNAVTGQISTNKELDRESQAKYQLNVMVQDKQGNKSSDRASVMIAVLDVNDNSPNFTSPITKYTTDEGNSSKNLNITFSATDSDEGDNGKIGFNLTTDINGMFEMTSTSQGGYISILRELRHDAKGIPINSDGKAVYSLNVVATDDGFPKLSSTATIDIVVSDINDCSPKFEKLNMTATIMEGSEPGFSVYRVTATDNDYDPKNRNLTYSISGTDQEYFSIDNELHGTMHYGIVKLEKQISERKEKYEVNVTVTDGENSNQALLTVTVKDVNDHDPEFTEKKYSFNISENDGEGKTRKNVTVGQVTAKDEDKNGSIVYRIATSDVKNLFAMGQDGWILLTGVVDHDNCSTHQISFSVVAEDTGSPKRMNFTEVVVTVNDINDNSPRFEKKSYVGSVEENSPNGTPVLFEPPISATDKDSGKYGTDGIVYSFNESSLPFTINSTSGKITVKGNLDWETKKEYNFTLVVKDNQGKNNYKSTHTDVEIKVKDVNDNTPYFVDPSNYTFSIPEDAEYGASVGNVTALDKDSNSILIYFIESGADGHFLMSNKTSGNIIVGKKLDREKRSNYTLNVTVSDGTRSSTTQVVIKLTDVNDNPPKFRNSIEKVVLVEGSDPGLIYTLNATDLDEGDNRNINYTLDSNSSNLTSLFNLSSDGKLLLNHKLDREKLNSDTFTMQVYAVEGGLSSSPMSASVTVQIVVEDINDNSPVFYNPDGQVIENFTASVLEMSPVNSIIYVPVCRDIDKGLNGTEGITFSLHCPISGGSDLLAINKTSGMVYIKSQISLNVLLHNANESSSIQKVNDSTHAVIIPYTVTALDGGKPGRPTNFTLFLTVENINDKSPVFESQFYNFSVPENASHNTLVGSIKAEVINETFFHLTYFMIDHLDVSANFSVNMDGSISTKGVLDRETKDHLTFVAKVVDGRVPERTAYTVVSVTLNDVNDNSPQFNETEYTYYIMENIEPTSLLTVFASDKDTGENAKIFYSLNGPGNERFRLNATTGTLMVNGHLDRENTSCYHLQITASDGGIPRQSSTVNVTVHVRDENDNSPEFKQSQYTANVSENLQNMKTIVNVSAEDKDYGLNGEVVYMIELEERSPFLIDSRNGTVFCISPLDFEDKSVYNVTIKALDLGSPSLNATTYLIVNVIDVPDKKPTFNQTLYEVTLNTTDKRGTPLLTLQAGQNVSYHIIDGNQEMKFEINHDTGEVTIHHPLAFGHPEYLLAVEARDIRSNFTATTKILVRIVDFNTHRDTSSDHPLTKNLRENLNETIEVVDLSTEADGGRAYGDALEYSIISVTPEEFGISSYFYINGTILYCNHSLDREQSDEIKITIQSKERQFLMARVKRSPLQSTDTIQLVLKVLDVNDNPPCFRTPLKDPPCFSNSSEDSLVFGVPISAKPGDFIGVIEASDPDSSSAGRVRYNITDGDVNMFYIYPKTGQIWLRRTVYQDQRDNYTLTVSASDQDRREDTATITVLVVPSSGSMILTVPGINDRIVAEKYHWTQKLGNLIGHKIEFEKSSPHKEGNQIDLCRTDVLFHCIDLKTKSLVPLNFVQEFVTNHSKEIADIFCQFLTASSQCQGCGDVTVQQIPLTHSSKMSIAEIALIVIGAVMLLGTVALIAVLLATPTSIEEENEKQTNGKVDMWELESMKSSSLSKATGQGVINPMFVKQEEDQTAQTSVKAVSEEPVDTEVKSTRKRSPSYESQEVVLDFQEDDGHHQINHSNADSGVDDESDSSHSGSIQTENEPGASGSTSGVKKGSSEQEITGLQIDMETGDTSDGERSGDESVGSRGQQSLSGFPDGSTRADILVHQGNIRGAPDKEIERIHFPMDTGDTTDDEISDDEITGSGGINKRNVNGMEVKRGETKPDQGHDQEWDGSGESRKSGPKSVSFKPGPPVVEEYEAEEDAVTSL